jgi:hypothetical protein
MSHDPFLPHWHLPFPSPHLQTWGVFKMSSLLHNPAGSLALLGFATTLISTALYLPEILQCSGLLVALSVVQDF